MEAIILAIIAVLLSALLTMLKKGINEMIKGLASIDERLARKGSS